MGNRYHELKISTARVKVGVGIAQLLLPLLIPLGSLAPCSTVTHSPGPILPLALLARSCCRKPPFWVSPMVLSAVYAYFFMNNLNVSQAGLSQGAGTRGGVKAHLDHGLPLHRTFDSFIGFSASLPVLFNSQFLEYPAIWPIAFGFAGAIGPYGGFLIPQAVGR